MDSTPSLCLREFAHFLSIPLHNTDGIKWPIRSGSVIAPVCDLFALQYTKQIDKLVNTSKLVDWNCAFPNSLTLWRFAHHVIYGLEKARLSKSEIAAKLQNIVCVINALLHNYRVEKGSHFALSNNDVISILSNELLTAPIDKQSLLKLSALLWAYSDALYFQGREVCCEYHGLYDCGQGTTMLVRDYRNLCPLELWPELTLDDTYRHIRIATLHDNTFKLFIDAYNNITVTAGGFAQSILGGMLFVNSVIENRETANTLISDFSSKLTSQTKYVNCMTDKQIYKKYLQVFWYRKKQLSDFLNEEWKPPQETYRIIDAIEVMQSPENPYAKISISDLEKKYDYSRFLIGT